MVNQYEGAIRAAEQFGFTRTWVLPTDHVGVEISMDLQAEVHGGRAPAAVVSAATAFDLDERDLWHQLRAGVGVGTRAIIAATAPWDVAAAVLAETTCDLVHLGAAHNRQTPPDVLDTLSRSTNYAVREQVATHPHTTAATLRAMAGADEWRADVLASVAEHPRCPRDVLEALCEHPDVDVHVHARDAREHLLYGTVARY